MTAFELGFLIVIACGVLCIAAYLAWLWRTDTAIKERDSTRTALDLANREIRQAHQDAATAARNHAETLAALETAQHPTPTPETLKTALCEGCDVLSEYRAKRHLLGSYAPHDPGANQ